MTRIVLHHGLPEIARGIVAALLDGEGDMTTRCQLADIWEEYHVAPLERSLFTEQYQQLASVRDDLIALALRDPNCFVVSRIADSQDHSVLCLRDRAGQEITTLAARHAW